MSRVRFCIKKEPFGVHFLVPKTATRSELHKRNSDCYAKRQSRQRLPVANAVCKTMLRIVTSPFLYKKRTLWGSFFGAENRTRTGTDFTPRDFKSLASAYSATSAFWRHHPESNRGWRLCRPLPYRLAMMPYANGFPTKRVAFTTLERETGFGPATSTLARWHSTTESLPHIDFLDFCDYYNISNNLWYCNLFLSVFSSSFLFLLFLPACRKL